MHHLRRLAVLPVAAVALGSVPAHAALPKIDSWNGKTKGGIGVGANRVRPSKTVRVGISVTCTTPEGQKQSFALTAEGKLRTSGRLKAKPVEDQGTPGGKLTLTGTFKPGRRAKGKLTYSIPATVAAGCAGTDTFSRLKYVLARGG